MSPMTNWELFHRYRRLVEDGKAKSLDCPTCESEVVVRLGKDDEPALWCYACNSYLQPGLNLIQQIRAVVTEHYV